MDFFHLRIVRVAGRSLQLNTQSIPSEWSPCARAYLSLLNVRWWRCSALNNFLYSHTLSPLVCSLLSNNALSYDLLHGDCTGWSRQPEPRVFVSQTSRYPPGALLQRLRLFNILSQRSLHARSVQQVCLVTVCACGMISSAYQLTFRCYRFMFTLYFVICLFSAH